MKTCKITLIGCDDVTYVDMDLNNDELTLLKKIEGKSKELSSYACMPVLEVEVVEDEVQKEGVIKNQDESCISREKFIYENGYGITTDIYQLPVGTKFRVVNGAWDGEIIEEDGIKKTLVHETWKRFELDEHTDYNLVIRIVDEFKTI